MILRRYLLLGVVLYLALLIVTIPGRAFAWAIERATGGVAILEAPRGTLWSGEASLVVPVAGGHLGLLRWQLNPLWLLLGRLGATVRLTGPSQLDASANARIGLGSARLMNVNASFDAGLIAQIYAPATLAGLAGRIALSTPEVQIEDKSINGTGEILWRNAASSISAVKPLGDYRAQISARGSRLELRMETLRGNLDVNGRGSLDTNAHTWIFNGTAHPVARANELAPLLSLLGPDAGGGRRILSMSGRSL